MLLLEFKETGGGKNNKLMLSHEDHGAVSQAHCFPRAEAEVGAPGGTEVLDVETGVACLVDGAVTGLEVTPRDRGVLTRGEEERGRRNVRRGRTEGSVRML